MKKARLLCLDVIDTGKIHVVTCGGLDDYHKYLKCDTFDITRRNIGGKPFDIFCDDIGLFADNPIPSALDENMKPVLVGNLIFANHDTEGNTTSLSDEDIKHIKEHLITVVNWDTPDLKTWEVACPVTVTYC